MLNSLTFLPVRLVNMANKNCRQPEVEVNNWLLARTELMIGRGALSVDQLTDLLGPNGLNKLHSWLSCERFLMVIKRGSRVAGLCDCLGLG
jgi:hypothetical protein